MKFRINLASQPYEDVRRFFTQWIIALALLVAFSGLLVYAAARNWRAAHTVQRQVAAEDARLKKLNEQEQQDLEILNRDQNRDVKDRAQALNAVLLRKEFSWTRIFADLEKIMPTRLHVVSIAPQLDKDEQIEIRMQVAGDSRDKAIELVRNMEQAPDFRDAYILSETTAQNLKNGPGQGGDTVQFEISALFVPTGPMQVDKPAEEQKGGEAKKTPAGAGGAR